MKKTSLFLSMVIGAGLFASELVEEDKENVRPPVCKQRTARPQLKRGVCFNAKLEQGLIYSDKGQIIERFEETNEAFLKSMLLKTPENLSPGSQD
jgi:hypothetical protein